MQIHAERNTIIKDRNFTDSYSEFHARSDHQTVPFMEDGATVATTPGETKVYIGISEHSFKTRFNNHKLSFKHRKHSHDTVLSKYIWDLKDNNTEFSIKWSIVTRASAYRGNPSRCNLCLTENLCILSADRSTLLNKRSELVTKVFGLGNLLHIIPGSFRNLTNLQYLKGIIKQVIHILPLLLSYVTPCFDDSDDDDDYNDDDDDDDDNDDDEKP
ncbi:hypothetical protein ACROYT_G007899 [Oculina patagonica]